MGMHETSLLYFIQKIRSWIPCGNTDSDSIFRIFETMDNSCSTCCHCKTNLLKSDLKYHCQNCRSLLCQNCIQGSLASFDETTDGIFSVKSCKFCFELSPLSKTGRRCSGKVYPSDSPRQSPEPPSPSFSGDSPLSATIRSDEDEGEQSTSHFLSTSDEYFRDHSDDVSDEFYSEKSPQQTLDFETNVLIWFPPPADDLSDEVENSLFTYDDEDDDVGDSGVAFLPSAGIDTLFSDKDKQNRDDKEPWRGVVEGHFRALVLQLLQGQGVIIDQENGDADNWLDIVTTISWQAAKFVKPDTGRGGSMDPCDYLKVKCVASGLPKESKLIKGIVCTKNIKHKRMMSQYKNARLLLLGGALEYQRVPTQLASFETLLQQENDYLKTIVSKIEAHRPNVLLVEKSVSSFALEHLLEKEISLVLNVKRPLLEMIARCSGATITPTTDHISTTRLGHCELFHLEKVSEDHESANQFNRKPSKTLMFFEGCPRRLGCTVVLRGSHREELKKVKEVVQYAVFAAYHLSLETSFLADEGATLPKESSKSSHFIPEKINLDKAIITHSADLPLEFRLQESLSELDETNYEEISSPAEFRYREALSEACDENLALNLTENSQNQDEVELELESPVKKIDDAEYFSANDTPNSILVSFSSHCVVNGTLCERSRLIRLKFYSSSDKPLGRFLRDDLFNPSNQCRSCKESAEAHVICYTHQHANLTINVKRLPSVKLPGEKDGKIWMWHRCLKCEYKEGVPPPTKRVVMSDSAWGLSFGKFLELSFSNHSTGNRVASCGHSLQRDCLRFYGCGSMVAFFRYSPINILSVRLPPSILEFGGPGELMWIRREAYELLSKARALHAEISYFLEEFKMKSLSAMDEFSDASELHRHVLELEDILFEEKSYYENLLQLADENITEEQNQAPFDILEINRLRHSLVISSQVWDRRIYSLDSLLKRNSSPKALTDIADLIRSKDSDTYSKEYSTTDLRSEDSIFSDYAKSEDQIILCDDEENIAPLERLPSEASILSDKIDSAWSGADVAPDVGPTETLSRVKKMGPTRVYSFDSAQRLQERMNKGLPPSSLYLSTLKSFHASGDYRCMVRDPASHVRRTFSQVSPREAEKLNLAPSSSFISSASSLLPEGARLMVPQNDVVVTVFDKEPTSIISYALSSKEYEDWISDNIRPNNIGQLKKLNSLASNLSTWHSFGSMDLDYINYRSYGSEDASATLADRSSNNSPHVRISFEDESSNLATKVKFSVTCYFAKKFDSLRRKCCPSEVDFIRSLSRCRRWGAQGGKSNVYFAKSFDERFIIKQVTKTELDSFEEFAPEYFKYLTDALSSGSPTCLAKVLGIYQVTVKHMRGGKEVKMDLMVMENLFFKRSISKVYDLKGSARSRYNADTTGANKVLLDTNLLETLRTNPIFLGSKAKRILERAVWNDTSFLASVDVMDYSLLVGVDEERKEMVIGIIDTMRQYTWDKHLETWVKASGILGGPKNASPTIVSPKQYKKRFRKAMTTYFLTVPDQWSS